MLRALPPPPAAPPATLSRGARVSTALELLRELERVAPQVTRWIQEPAATRGPRPLCDARALALMADLRALYAPQV